MYETTSNSCSNLFRGAARLGILLGSLDLSWYQITPYVSTFSDELNTYQELSLNNTGENMGVMTCGNGKDFAFRVAHYMETHGIDEERLRRFLVRAQFLEYRNLFFKVEIGSEGLVEFSYYFRRRSSLEVARAWLADTGVDIKELSLIEDCAQVLQKHSVHFLAAAECPNGQSLQKIYFSQREDGYAWKRVRIAGQLVGLTDDSWQTLVPHQDALSDRPLFFSLTFGDGHLIPGAKLDVGGVDFNTVGNLMKQTRCSQKAREQTQFLLELSEKKKFDYVGLKLYPNAPLTTKVYVYESSF
ncbi:MULTISPECIES: hypothetical protein [unclassified Moorena]|uniref:hypothetical protein n=1 Tax=unclassified Moorena TaxID=2683338 RepID=UPI0013FF29FB|nr:MULTISPECIES: hypothetical protein [unclassified Moorena]NEO15007.1 hypothetical protein [Moorena sp. SIO3E8]NEQ01411.1 hypothetical protein [Moorena sp. SIO3F7]